MSFKMIGLAVFIAGVLGLAYLLFFTGKSSKKPVGEKGDRKPTLDELFPIDEVTGERIYQQDDPDSVIVSDNELTPAIYVGYKRHKFLLPAMPATCTRAWLRCLPTSMPLHHAFG
nr:hypothetical protein [Providencia heimbachae]